MRATYPLMLDVTDRLIVIVGGGNVACRKAKGLTEAGAKNIRVVSPVFVAEFPAEAQKLMARFEPQHVDGASLVFAATDSSEVNDAVVKECRRRNIWVNRADSPADFTTPAVWRDGAVMVAISAAGAPALAAAIRDAIADRFDPRWAKMADAMQTLRPELIEKLPPDSRRAAMIDLAGEEAMKVLDSQGLEALKRWISQRYPHK